MNRTSRTVVLIFIAVAITALGLKLLKSGKAEEQEAKTTSIVKAVRIEAVKLTDNFAKVEFSGKLSADKKIEIYSEVSGLMLSDNFRAGNTFKKGDVIAQLNSAELINNLKAKKSELLTKVASTMGDLKIDYPSESEKWEMFLNAIDVNEKLPNLPEIEDQKLKRFISGKNILSIYFSIKAQEDNLNKFTIVAPFNGVLIEGDIKKGTLIKGGQKIGEFINTGKFELESEVSLLDLSFVKAGYPMTLHSDELRQDWKGVVSRVNSAIDRSSQMVKVYIQVKGTNLREGMYLYGTSNGQTFENSFSINRKLLNNGGVYLVEDGRVVHKKVEVNYVSQSTAIVSGLKSGEQLIADNMKGLYTGLVVEVKK